MQVTVIVCTYNRSRLLERLLDSMVAMAVPEELSWELLVIDNNSRDETPAVAERYSGRLPLTYRFEARQGKCHALNRGLKEARGELLLFLDDDVHVGPGWLQAFALAAEDARYDWFGGRVKPDWRGALPGWYRVDTAPAFSGYFGDYDLGERPHAYEQGEKLPLGASLGVRRAVFDRVGEFRLDLGPRGKLRGVGDETELLERAIAAGFAGWYVGDTTVLHHVGPERLRLSGFVNYGVGKGLNQYRMGVEGGRAGSLRRAGSQVLRGVYQLAKGRGDRMRLCLINYGIEMGRRRAAREGSAEADAR
ncbi:MAG: glycosyltransferase [Bryobacter sp.]|jgi:glycosyltransferase involved in cell wall biosynthesis|nr:glycosyltransferase [Bryobacter sp.]